MKKKVTIIVKSCKSCPFHSASPAQGAWEHVCEKRKRYLSSEYYNGNKIHPECPLEDNF